MLLPGMAARCDDRCAYNPWAISSRDAVSERSERRVWSVVSSHDFICVGVKLGDGFVMPGPCAEVFAC
jgi:hypothetical protein